MSILDVIAKKQREKQCVQHPFARADISARMLYITGLAIMVQVNGRTTENTYIDDLAQSLNLPCGSVKKILKVASDENKVGNVFDDVIETISKNEDKILFLFDLCFIALSEGAFGKKEEKLWKVFAEALSVSEGDKEKIRSFMEIIFADRHWDSIGLRSLLKILLGQGEKTLNQTAEYLEDRVTMAFELRDKAMAEDEVKQAEPLGIEGELEAEEEEEVSAPAAIEEVREKNYCYAELKVFYGRELCMKVILQSERTYSLGRAEENDIVIAVLTVSAVHVRISLDEQGDIYLMDNNSTNGTFVNNRKLAGQINTKIAYADRIMLGKNMELSFTRKACVTGGRKCIN